MVEKIDKNLMNYGHNGVVIFQDLLLNMYKDLIK